ncbi:MAG: chemotaxis response regulator protein-glutamate methylesterase [Planctomycetota bacterium]
MMTAPTTSEPRRRIRVLVVDDSALVRKAITDALSMDPEIEVVGSACDPYVAREKILRLDPDVLTLDLEMPRMDGLTFLRILMEQHPLPVVVVSSLTQAGSQLAMEAMEAGAVDVLAKPGGSTTVGALADQLAYHVKAAAASVRFRNRRTATPRGATPSQEGVSPGAAAPATASPVVPRAVTTRFDPRQVIVIGASTGGIEALRTVLPQLPPTMPPILVVQHISAYFSKVVAERLDRVTTLEVREAEEGLALRPGLCLIAPGDLHLAIARQGNGYTTRLVKSPPVHHCRPAVDVLFRSAAEAAGPRVVAALLTGMGSDGALGMQAIRMAGGFTIAEDERTCVVYGMPRKAIEMGVVDRVLQLPMIAEGIIDAAVARSA